MPIRQVQGGLTGLATNGRANSVPVGSQAESTLGVGAAMTCGLCFLGSLSPGNADYSVTGGSIAVNGSVTQGPQATMSATGGTIGLERHRFGRHLHPRTHHDLPPSPTRGPPGPTCHRRRPG